MLPGSPSITDRTYGELLREDGQRTPDAMRIAAQVKGRRHRVGLMNPVGEQEADRDGGLGYQET